MDVLVIGAFFALGTVVASFIGVVSGRLYTGQSFVNDRSRCDSCGIPLTAGSLVPLLSFLTSRGRALCCGSRISLVGPLSELMLGALFALAYLRLGLTPSLIGMLVSLALLLCLVLYDAAHQILPTPLLVLFVVSSAATAAIRSATLGEFGSNLTTASALAAFLLALHYLSRGRAMGFADAPLVFGLALLTGAAALSGFVYAFWIGAVVGIGILAARPVGSRMGVEVPFAPYLAAGFLLAYFTQWNLFFVFSQIYL